MFSEQGAYEALSPVLWLILAVLSLYYRCIIAVLSLYYRCIIAVLSLFHPHFKVSTRWVMAISSLLFALREWDMHKVNRTGFVGDFFI
ncbi:hypothetical protein [Acinetobacter wanghuae]|uniref:hypothetical protein n=1 Tax=Acinetobacter wanghuae TaxID=2662362 RepID=UPI003AF6A3EA